MYSLSMMLNKHFSYKMTFHFVKFISTALLFTKPFLQVNRIPLHYFIEINFKANEIYFSKKAFNSKIERFCNIF